MMSWVASSALLEPQLPPYVPVRLSSRKKKDAIFRKKSKHEVN